MDTELNDLVIGRKYKVKNIEWFENKENNPSSHYSKHAGKEMILHEIANGYQLVLRVSWNYGDGEAWLKREEVEEIPGQPEPCKEILDAIAKLKEENFIYGYDGGPGGGDGRTINTQKEHILPVFEKDGSQSILISVTSCKRTFALNKINELFEKGETSQGFHATEWTYIRTDLKLIEDKTKLPDSSRWSTMRD